MPTAPWERAWLDVARRLLEDDAHIAACDGRLGPEAVSRCDAPDLRWPGYLGAAYQPGGVLIAMTVHRDFASGSPPLPPAMRDDLIAATRSWRDRRIGDDEWLERLRAVYVAGLEQHWRVGRIVRDLRAHVDLGVEQLAYVNTARCQVVESLPKLAGIGRIKQSVVGLCTREQPLTDVTDAIRPSVVLLPKATWDLVGTSFGDVPVLAVHQRQGTLCVPFGRLRAGASVRDWTGLVRELVGR